MMLPQRTKEHNLITELVIALAIAVVGAGPVAASEEAEVMGPVRQFVDGFNKNDLKMAKAACADETFIIDDFPPHEWHGTGATSKWFHDLKHMGAKNGMSDAVVTLLKPDKVNITGGHAYVIVPIKLRYNDRGQLVRRTGLMTLALHRGADGWRIAAWAWIWH